MGVSGIALCAIDSPAVCSKINSLVDAGINVVTCNTDNSSSTRRCFVGFKNELSGRVAAELFAKFSRARGKYIVEIGFEFILAHMDRLAGFIDKIKESYPEMQVVNVLQSGEQDYAVQKNILAALDEHPDLSGIYLTCLGIDGVVDALKSRGFERRVKIICHDKIGRTNEYISDGIVEATICQDGVKHGYMAMKILSEIIIQKRQPRAQMYLTNLDIRLKENLGDLEPDWEI
jgi:LacI family transcriptional regulator